jgi:hypothetical protein
MEEQLAKDQVLTASWQPADSVETTADRKEFSLFSSHFSFFRKQTDNKEII